VAGLDKIIHEQARLLIMTYLASSEKKRISFRELQQELEFTSGNLSVQLKKLETAGYVTINKTFKDNKPYTTVAVSTDGIKALQEYLGEMEGIINRLKN
jgi:DNA-binding MarR family transcriptional regulator